jgi:hypothetical protein
MKFLKHSVVLCVIVALTGCADTMQPRRFAPLGKDLGGSGFLGGLYASMHEGKDGQYRLVYQNPKVLDREWFAQYTQILLDPVQLYAGPNSTLPKVSQEQRETLAQAFYARIYHEFEKDYQMVTQPGPKTFRIQVAIVDAEESGGVLEAISYIPIPAGVPGAKMALLSSKIRPRASPS